MVKGLILILGLLAGWPVLGQAPGSDAAQVLLAAPPPAPVISANAQTVGNRGSRVFFYWVVANFPVGKSVPYGPAQVSNVADTLTGGNYVRVVWSPVTGATSYDVLRTTTAVLPNGAANIAVATSVSGTLYDNASETINSYTVSSASTASGFWSLDNRGYSLPVMTFSSDPIVPTFIGTTLPSACVVGQKFFKTDATAGANLHLCTSTNVWTVNGSSGVCANCVLGASNLTTTNRMVRVSAAGTVTETTDFIRTGAGLYQFYDGIGPTTLTVRAGSVQGTTQLQQWAVSAGTVFAYVDPLNQSINSGAFRVGNASGGFWNSGGFAVPSTASILWSTTTNAATGVYGLGLVQSSANNLAVTNGSSTTYATIGAGGIQMGADNTYPIGAVSSGRPSTLDVFGRGTFGGILTGSNLKQGSGSPEGVVSGVVGDIYQNTTGGAGTSAYIKESGVGTTGWVAIAPGSGGSGLFQTLINDLRPTITTTTLTLDAGRCWGANKVAATAVITAGAGNGSFVAYCTDTQTLVVEDATAAGLTITCTNCTRIQTATPQVPEGLYPVATGTITTGQWTAVTDSRDFTTRFRFQNGAGMATTVVGSVVTEAVDPVQVQMTANDYDVVTRLDATVSTSSAPAKTGTSLPGTCIVGDQYFKSDEAVGGNLYGCTTGNVWTKVGGGTAVSKNGVYLRIAGVDYLTPGMYAVTAPTTVGNSWLANQGTASATTTSTGGALKLNLTTGTAGIRVYGASLAGSTKVTAVIGAPSTTNSGGANIQAFAFGFRESGTGRLQFIRVQVTQLGGVELAVSNYSNPTTYVGNLNNSQLTFGLQNLFVEAEITGGNNIYRWSSDGTNWQEIGREATGTYVTPDEYFVGGEATSIDTQVLMYSFVKL